MSLTHTDKQKRSVGFHPPGQVETDGLSHLAEGKDKLTAEWPEREKRGHEEWVLEL